MPPLSPDAIRTLTETLSDLTVYLRENPEPEEALALVEPLLDEYTGLPVQLADTLRALARTLEKHLATPHSAHVDFLITELRAAAWEQSDQHALHYVLDDLSDLHANAAPSRPGCGRCQ
ncbi:hypothetical protein [Streptomyces sp. 8L]|uniref:hypothetical protein n=1 Tax=Streptomyces sp. 8L TaxID=2877242 RepID=UPI001CD23EFD|nr:hypothetical protein [Streptomyces sp. 8L]MCA1223524.1 hypothetical protein [Streptomyces sp. 8L]